MAVVTGGSAGIGLATVQALAQQGWAVAIIARDEARLEQAAAMLRQSGARVLAISADVADAEAIDAAADRIEAELGTIEAWVNNAMSTVIAAADKIIPQEYARVTATTYLAQSAPSCDFGQVGERFGNVAFGIDDGNHRRGQFAPS